MAGEGGKECVVGDGWSMVSCCMVGKDMEKYGKVIHDMAGDSLNRKGRL